MRRVSRTHRVALDWLFARINLESKIQIKYVDTKNQLADILTKGSFSRDEWNHLLCLSNIMCFLTYSGSHLKSSLKPESALWLVPCRNEDKTQTRVMGLRWQKPDLPNVVLRGQCKEGVSSQGSGSPVNPVIEYNRKRVSLAAGNWVVLSHIPKLEVPKCIDKRWST